MGLFAGELSIGGQYWGWSGNFSVLGRANEIYIPFSISVEPVSHLTFYAQTELELDFFWTNPLYDSAYPYSKSTDVALSDTTIGVKKYFPFLTGGDLFVNVGFNLPSGDVLYWHHFPLIMPSFVDLPYQGVTFGIGAMVGVDLPDGNGQFTLGAGYMDPGVFNSTFGIPLGNSHYSQSNDTFLFTVAHSQTFDDGATQSFSLWAFFHDPMYNNEFKYGPSFDIDYRFQKLNGFSLDAGGQIFLISQLRYIVSYQYPTITLGPFVDQPYNIRGPFLYVDPSFTFGEVSIRGQAHYCFPNDVPKTFAPYDGSGWLLGIGPLWKIPMNSHSDISVSGSFNKIIYNHEFYDSRVGYVRDAHYDIWHLGLEYDLHF